MFIELGDFKERVANTVCGQYTKMRNYITQNEDVLKMFTDYINNHMSHAITQIDDRKLFLKRTLMSLHNSLISEMADVANATMDSIYTFPSELHTFEVGHKLTPFWNKESYIKGKLTCDDRVKNSMSILYEKSILKEFIPTAAYLVCCIELLITTYDHEYSDVFNDFIKELPDLETENKSRSIIKAAGAITNLFGMSGSITPVFDEIIGDASKFGFIVENYSRKVNTVLKQLGIDIILMNFKFNNVEPSMIKKLTNMVGITKPEVHDDIDSVLIIQKAVYEYAEELKKNADTDAYQKGLIHELLEFNYFEDYSFDKFEIVINEMTDDVVSVPLSEVCSKILKNPLLFREFLSAIDYKKEYIESICNLKKADKTRFNSSKMTEFTKKAATSSATIMCCDTLLESSDIYYDIGNLIESIVHIFVSEMLTSHLPTLYSNKKYIKDKDLSKSFTTHINIDNIVNSLPKINIFVHKKFDEHINEYLYRCLNEDEFCIFDTFVEYLDEMCHKFNMVVDIYNKPIRMF